MERNLFLLIGLLTVSAAELLSLRFQLRVALKPARGFLLTRENRIQIFEIKTFLYPNYQNHLPELLLPSSIMISLPCWELNSPLTTYWWSQAANLLIFARLAVLGESMPFFFALFATSRFDVFSGLRC